MSTSYSGGHAPDDDRSFAVAIVIGEDGWHVRDLGESALESLVDAAGALRDLRAERAAFGVLNVDDDYFIIFRPGMGSLRVLLSDATAAVTDDIAAEVFDELDMDVPDIDEDDLDDTDAWAEGDMDILADLGVSEDVLSSICEDQAMWASEQVFAIASELGCEEELSEVTGLDPDALGDGEYDSDDFGDNYEDDEDEDDDYDSEGYGSDDDYDDGDYDDGDYGDSDDYGDDDD